MASLLRIEKSEFERLKELNKDQYGNFLEKKLEDLKNDPYYKRFKIVSQNELYRVFAYPPVMITKGSKENSTIEIKYEETLEQRKERLRLKSKYRELYANEIKNKKLPVDYYEEDSVGLEANYVEKCLGISRKTLYNLQDSNEENFKTYVKSKKLYVEKESLFEYISKRHYESSNCDMENMYLKIKELKISLTEQETSANVSKIHEIVDSKEYKEKWDNYFNTVPEEQRVFKITPTIHVNLSDNENEKDDVEIFVKKKEEDNFDIYNPNVKICDSKINELPKLYPASYWAAILGVVNRTVLKYCELGYLKHYKIGSKYMISAEDFIESKSLIDNKNKSTKSNVGRKKKIELVFSENDTESNEHFLSLAKNSVYYNEISNLFQEKIKLEDELETYKKNKKIIEDKNRTIEDELELKSINLSIKKVEAALARINKNINRVKRIIINEIFDKEDIMEDLKEDIEEYNKLKKSLKNYRNDLEDAIKENSNLKNQLQYIVSEFEGRVAKKKQSIISKTLKKQEDINKK